jgi:hypothetical protein
MQPAAGKIKYDDFNKTDFGQCPVLAVSSTGHCNTARLTGAISAFDPLQTSAAMN